jgi:putative pyoverdin transport system ATP-binding/permease protein
MKMLTYMLRQSWKLLAASSIAGAISGLAGAALVAVIGDGLRPPGASSALAAKFFGLALLYLLSKTVADLSLLRLTQSAVARLRVELGRKILATPLPVLDRFGKHRLQAILTRDVEIFVQAFQALPMVFSDVVLLLACLGYLAWLAWDVFVCFTLILMVCLAAYHWAERGPARQLEQVREHIDTLFHGLRGLIEGSRELKLNARRRRHFLDHVVQNDAWRLRDTFVRAMSGYTWVLNTGGILFYLVIGLVVFVLPQVLQQQTATLTTVTLVLMYLIRPISEVMASMPALKQAAIALRQIESLDGQLLEVAPAAAGPDPFAQPLPLALELRAVAHRAQGGADDSQFHLGPLSLQVRRGEILFVIGGNGSGKTTLAMLLLGLYEPEQGGIVLNGVPVTQENREHYRQHFAAVLSDFYLFDQVHAAGDSELDARAAQYLEAFGLAHKVRVENGRFSTTKLSAGQRRRLALVSAYLEDRPFYLFDEWAADQDPVFKRVFYTEILPGLQARGKTVIVISHDDGYFAYADRIVKLADGQLQPMPAAKSSPLGTQAA